jgi:predicted DNA-binding transcriptional regulator AlpA
VIRCEDELFKKENEVASNFLPETGFIRLPEVLKLIPFGKSTLWVKVKSGTFPTPIKLSERITAWRVEDIRNYINNFSEKKI